ncbi:MAG: 1-deoxy-D-xylulose-5-phosphate reductoisomerase [Clostridiaceae bacterium]|nr:1-deoxy-D-xylulose-5-phosphate reductoisomerase [Clostridiaceae bacterium]
MTKNLAILGSTGSIGVQALEVCDNLNIPVSGLSAGGNISLLEQQARKYKPSIVSVMEADKGRELKIKLRDTATKVVWGLEGMLELVSIPEADTVLTSVVGIAGLLPTMRAIREGKNIALANKETLVTAGKLVMEEARQNRVQILPVDSEHSALFQSLAGNRPEDVDKLVLTASGGPFRGFTAEQLSKVTLKQALKHPNWAMGSKITIDSATMMNKGLEVIEAQWLFDMDISRIEVLVHPQSIIHSMVSFQDGSIIAQLGAPDMRIPIQLALTWPERRDNQFDRVDFTKMQQLTFEKPDDKVFRCLNYAFRSSRTGGSLPVVMNASNEVAVALFLQERIHFTGIMDLIENVMDNHKVHMNPSIDDIIEIDGWSREETMRIYNRDYSRNATIKANYK